MQKQRMNKSTIGNDPFGTVIPLATNDTDIEVASPRPSVVTSRQKITVKLNDDLLNRVKNAAYWNPRLTIAKIAEQAIGHAIEKIESENGGPYPQRESELVGGRPIK